MGCFSIPCAISGIPIYCEPSVLIEIDRNRYGDHSMGYPWLPISFPFFGNCDTYGRVDGYDNSSGKKYIVILREVWNNAELFWHPWNKNNGLHLNPEEILDYAKAKMESHKLLDAKLPEATEKFMRGDLADYVALGIRINRIGDYNYILDQLNDTEPTHGIGNLLCERGPLLETICQKIINGTLDKEAISHLEKIICLWSGSTLTGKFITPYKPHSEQNADDAALKARKKINSLYNKIMTDMIKEKKRLEMEDDGY